MAISFGDDDERMTTERQRSVSPPQSGKPDTMTGARRLPWAGGSSDNGIARRTVCIARRRATSECAIGTFVVRLAAALCAEYVLELSIDRRQNRLPLSGQAGDASCAVLVARERLEEVRPGPAASIGTDARARLEHFGFSLAGIVSILRAAERLTMTSNDSRRTPEP